MNKIKIKWFSSLLFIALLLTNSCKKDKICYRCILMNDIEEFCIDDYKNKEDFENAKELMELICYDCDKRLK